MHYKSLFSVGLDCSYGGADFSVPASSQGMIDRSRNELADMLEFLAKAMREKRAPFTPPSSDPAKPEIKGYCKEPDCDGH